MSALENGERLGELDANCIGYMVTSIDDQRIISPSGRPRVQQTKIELARVATASGTIVSRRVRFLFDGSPVLTVATDHTSSMIVGREEDKDKAILTAVDVELPDMLAGDSLAITLDMWFANIAPSAQAYVRTIRTALLDHAGVSVGFDSTRPPAHAHLLRQPSQCLDAQLEPVSFQPFQGRDATWQLSVVEQAPVKDLQLGFTWTWGADSMAVA